MPCRRWARLERAVETARLQSHRAVEVIVPIDRNPELLDRATSRWVDMHDGSSVMVIDDSGVEADDAERTLHAGSTAPAAGSAPVWHATPRPSVRPAKSSPSAKTPGPTRTSSSGFWRRCFYVNKYKVAAFDNMGQAATLTAEFAFVRRYATRGAYRLGSAVRHREPVESVRAAADTLGIALGGLGNLAGRLQRGRRNQEVAT